MEVFYCIGEVEVFTSYTYKNFKPEFDDIKKEIYDISDDHQIFTYDINKDDTFYFGV